jgi:hypothetical protein
MRRSQHTRSFVSMALWRGVLFRRRGTDGSGEGETCGARFLVVGERAPQVFVISPVFFSEVGSSRGVPCVKLRTHTEGGAALFPC